MDGAGKIAGYLFRDRQYLLTVESDSGSEFALRCRCYRMDNRESVNFAIGDSVAWNGGILYLTPASSRANTPIPILIVGRVLS